MKRILVSILLVFALVLTLCPSFAFAAGSGKCGADVTWTLSSDGVVTISGTGPMYDRNELYSKKLYPRWENYQPAVRKVVVEEGVTNVQFDFYGIQTLKSVTLPSTLIRTVPDIFGDCAGLTEVVVASANVGFGSRAFKGCTGLAKDGFIIVNGWLFDYIGSAADVVVPDGVKLIDINAFDGCAGLKSVEIPEGVTEIRGNAFRSCHALASVKIPASVDSIGYASEEDANFASMVPAAFCDCPNVTIAGYDGTAAETHAKDLSIPFVSLGAPPVKNPFTDVAEGAYYYAPVLWAVQKQITNGTSATAFSPGDNCTRAQIVTFLWRAFGSPKPASDKNPFTDVKKGDYFYEPVLWAVASGITTGTSATTFSPSAFCTRGQAVTFLWRAAGKPAADVKTNPFSDVSASAYYREPVLWALKNNVTNGTSATTFSPDSTCTRGQIVTFLYRSMATA